MFQYSRFVAVDDKLEHLTAIKSAFDQLRLDCHTKIYDVETVGGWQQLPGTRVLFMDKNLRPGVTVGAAGQDSFAAIAEVIEKLISPKSGPYGLILWADHPEIDALKTFLNERMAEHHPDLLPVFFDELRKGDYINTNTGEVINAERLKTDIVAALKKSPQMTALFSWEADVMAASDALLRSIIDLVPKDQRRADDFAPEIGKVLYRLSQAGSGIGKARDNPRESVNRVLVPILADRIVEHDPEGAGSASWADALVDPGPPTTPSVQAQLNTAIHLSAVRQQADGGQPIKASDLGAVVEFPFLEPEKALPERFGITKDQLTGILKLNDKEWPDCQLRLIQIGATCDHAQPKPGPLVYLLGVQWIYATDDGARDEEKPSLKKREKTLVEAEWLSPLLMFPGADRPGKLSVFRNLIVSIPPAGTATWTPVYRLRDELINELTQQYARHISRPGIVTVP